MLVVFMHKGGKNQWKNGLRVMEIKNGELER